MLQNLDIAAGAGRGALTMLRRRKGVPAAVAQALETIGLAGRRDQPAGTLAHGQKQWLEIGMLLVQDVRLLLLDEPVAGMSHDERDATGELLGVHQRGAHRGGHRARHGLPAPLRAHASPCCTPARC